jgi:hypothetical protein
LTPDVTQIKHVSGYDQCSDWSLLESETLRNMASEQGEPISTCGIKPNSPQQSKENVGIRRAQLSHWPNFPLPLVQNEDHPAAINFIDWDGVNSRNPLFSQTIFGGLGRTALRVTIGNLDAKFLKQCKESSTENDLKLLSAPLVKLSGISFEYQYQCSGKAIPFLTEQPSPWLSMLVDARAEWSVSNIATPMPDAPRTSSSTLRTSNTVTETAYRILEQSLKVEERNKSEGKRNADVQVVFDEDKSVPEAKVIVSYNWPLNSFLGKLIGKENLLIRQSAIRRNEQPKGKL